MAVPPKGTQRPRVGIALPAVSPAASRTSACLRVLREAGIPVDVVAGTSVGALIAAGYCAGTPLETMERIAYETKFTDFGRWTPSWLGLATNKRLEAFHRALDTRETLRRIAEHLSPSPPPISI